MTEEHAAKAQRQRGYGWGCSEVWVGEWEERIGEHCVTKEALGGSVILGSKNVIRGEHPTGGRVD
jgi:hypothetical protein